MAPIPTGIAKDLSGYFPKPSKFNSPLVTSVSAALNPKVVSASSSFPIHTSTY